MPKPDTRTLLRGIVETLPEGELVARVGRGEKLRVKFGADPTAPDLHLGHMVVLRKLRQFQDLGHTVVFIIGDFTARVGDPSGRNAARPPLSPEIIEANSKTYMDQMFRILDRGRTEVVRNSDWLAPMTFADVLRLASLQTVSQVIHRRDFHERLSSDADVMLHEILYPLMQGHDSVVVKSDVEIGGSDQKFNLLVGRDLQEKAGQRPQCIMTLPLLVGTDGKQKMSKSFGNYIGFLDEPEEMYGKIMSISDDIMWDYWVLLTDRDEKELAALRSACASGSHNPRDAKADLAKTLITFLRDADAALRAEAHFRQVVVDRQAPDEVEEFSVSPVAARDLPALLVSAGLAASKSDARRLIQSGAVYINGARHEDGAEFRPASGDLIKVGKRRFARLKLV